MATAFNLTAQINLRGPSNVRNIVSDIRRQLGTISADVNVRINPTNTRNIAGLSRALADLNNNLTATANNANNAANAIRQFGAAVSSIGNSAAGLNRNLNNTGAAANNAAAGMRNVGTQTNAASTEMVEFGRTAGLAVRRFAAFSMSAGVIMGLTNAVRKGVEAFIEYDRQFVKLQQVTGESASGLSQLSRTITGLSTSLGVSSSEITEVASTLAQAGLTARDTERALKALALSSLAPSFDSMNQTVEGSIALMRQFGIGANDLEKALGAVNAVSAKFAVEAGDIIAAIQRTGGVFSSASKGVSQGTDALNEFIAVFTSVRATTRESAETIATGLRTIFTRIQRGGTIEALKEFGVNLTDVEGKFVGAYKAVQLLSEGLNQIDPRDLRFSEIIEELGGFRQIGKVIPLIQQFTTAQQALAVAQAGQTSLTEDAVIAQLSLANQAAKVREQFLALFREIGGSDTFQGLAKGALGLASALISVADSVKGILPVLAIMTAFKGASAIRQFGTGFLRGVSPGGGQRANLGGKIRRYSVGGNVPVALTPGEAVFSPEHAAKIGTSTLRKMNYADKNGYRQKRARGGGVSIVPGQGNTDSFYTTLPPGSFVVRKKATAALGLNQRKGFAVGGTVSDLGGSLIRSSVRETSFTYDKKAGDKFETVGSVPTKFNTRDKYTYEKINRKINVDTLYSDTEKKTNPVYREYKGLSTSAKYGGSKGIRGNSARNRGYAFEKVLQDRIKNLSLENKANNEFSRLDGTIGPNVFEAKSEKEALTDKKLSEKMVSAALSNKSKSEKNMSNRLTSNPLDSKANTIGLGPVILFQDTTSGLGQEKETETKTKKKTKKKTVPKANAFGGYVQKLMAGQYVKSRAGRKTREILSDITMADVAKYPASKIIGELGVSEIDSILASAGVFGIPANKFLRQYKLDPAQQKAKQLVASKYVEKINAKAAANRAGGSQATASATSRGALFGAIGMFGSSFAPEDLQITTDPNKPPITVRAFGAVLDKNKAAKNARLQEREQRLQGINTRRSARGKSELLDTRAIDIKAAPTAAGLGKQYLKEDLSGVTKRTNQTIIKSVLNALSGGSGTKAFFDFDKTLAFRTNPLGYKEEKLKKGQKSKNPDYTAFGDMSKVEKGLLKAKPSMLLLKLAKLVSTTRQKMPDQLGTLLSNMNVVTARPQNTMGPIGSWLASKGVPIPLNNIKGVGGTGMSNKDVAVAKANTILGMAGSSSSLFVDDDATNIAASQQAGIRSYSYGAKLPLTKAVKKAIADSQGSKFQNDITSNLAQTPEGKRLLNAMENDTQQRSIDFPYGIGQNLATNWFNNPLLARIPVDAKRTLTGPRGKLSDNIKNFLKARGFASGGMVQKFADDDFVEHAGIRYSKDDVTKIATKLGVSFEQLRDEMQDRKTTGFKDYTMSAKRLGELRKLGLSAYKGLPSAVQQAFSAANPELDAKGNHPGSYRGARIKGSFGRGRYAKGDVVRDPKNTLEGYFKNSKFLNAGERHKGMLRSAGRNEQADRKKDMKKLETPAPPVLYNSLSRAAFDSMAMQVGLNKNPEFPPGTKYFDQEKYYDQEVAKISGRNFKLSGYLSTSANNNKAKLFLDNAQRYKDGWGSFMKIQTKPKAKAVNVVKQLEGRSVGGVKKDKLTGQTLYQKSPESEEEFVLRPNSRFRINSAKFHRPGTNKNIWMDVQQFANGGSLYKNDKNKKAGYDPKKLAAFLGASPVTTDKQDKLAKMLNDGKIEKPNYEELLKKSTGYAAGGEIPIMAQKGEYVINRNSAQDLGYNNLEKLNKGGFAALKKLPKYHSGGIVQKFAKGSTVRPLEPGQYIRSGMTYDIRAGEADALQQREEQIRQRARERQQRRTQMAESTPQGQALRRDVTQEGNKRIQTIQNKYGTNIVDIDQRILKIKQVALKKLGVSISDGEAMNQLIKLQLKSDKEIAQAKKTAAMQYKQGLKGIESDVSGQSSKYDPRMGMAGGNKTGQNYYDNQYRKERIEGIKQNRSSGVGGALRSAGLRVRDFVSRVAPNALKSAGLMPLDPREKAIADQRKVSRAIAPVAAGRRASASVRALTQSDAFRALPPEAKKQALTDAGYGNKGAGSQAILTGNQSRKSGGRFSGKNGSGSGGGGGGGGSGGGGNNQGGGMNRAMMASFMIPMITDMFSGGTPTTTSGAYSQTATQGVATSVGSSLMMGSVVKDMTEGMGGIAKFAGPAAMTVTAVIGMTKAFIDAENAAREMAISLASKDLESSIEVTTSSLQKFAENLKDQTAKDMARAQVLQTIGKTETLSQEREKPQRGFANLFDSGENSNKRSDILFTKGADSYVQTLQDPISRMLGLSNKKDSLGYSASDRALSKEYASLIPARSRERSKDFQGASQATQDFLSSNIKSGTSISDLKKDDRPQFDSFIRSLALADASIQEQIMNIENSTSIQKEQKEAIVANIIAQNGERKARELQNRILKEKAFEELNRSANHLQNSLERMFQNMEQAIGRNVYELNNLSQQAELSANALSGNAKAGQVSLKSINVLQNPRAYSKADRNSATQNAASMFGSESGMMKGLLQAGGTLEDTVMSTINKTMKEDPTAGNEKIGIRVQNNIAKALESLQLPPDISEKLGKQVNEAIGQIRQKGDEKIDFGDLMEKIPQLGKVMESTRRAQEAALKALEHLQSGFNDYANSMNQVVESTIESNMRFRRASDIQSRGQMELNKVLGKEISLKDQLNAATAGIRSQTGGTADPARIAQNVRSLDAQRAVEQSMSNTATSRGLNGVDEFRMMQDRLKNTNIALRENYDALKNMADNTEMASIAMSKINEIQQKRQAGVNMAERLVTSSPQELSQLNRAMDRLSNNMQGGINFGSSADQRKESLDAFNMIAPFLGEKQNETKANVLESMLMESGVGVNPMMAEVLQSLRNPEGDPEMQAAIAAYNRAVDLQVLANRELAVLSQVIAKNTEETAATKFASMMSTFKFTFEGMQLSDVVDEVRMLREVVEKNPAAMAPGKANGGIIYASAGQMVNFQPKGTDTVPAMLTPGEFVVNRAATQRNLPLLKNINSGNYSNGGKVRYYEDGGYVAVNDKWSGMSDSARAKEEYNQTSKKTNSLQLSNLNWDYLKDNDITKERFHFFDRLGYVLTSTAPEDLVKSKVLYKNNDIYQPNLMDTKITGKSLYWGLGSGISEISFASDGTNLRKYRGLSNTDLSTKYTELPSRSWIDDVTNMSKPIAVEQGSKEVDNITNKTESLLKDLPTVYPKVGQIVTSRNNRITYDPSKLKPQNASPSFSLDSVLQFDSEDAIGAPSGAGGDYSRAPRGSTKVKTKVGGYNTNNYNLLRGRRKTSIGIMGLTQPISNATHGSLLFPEEIKGLINSDPVKSNTITTVADPEGNIGGGNFLSKIVSRSVSSRDASQVVTDDIGASTAFMTDYINKINLLQENLSSANFKLKDSSSFKETEESLKLKEKISNFTNLFNNTTASAEFTNKIPGIQSPLRLYNENISAKWDTYAKSIKKIQETKPLSYSVSKPDFIEIKNLKNEQKKSFAWTDGGFAPDDYNSIFGEAAKSQDMVGQNVITSPGNYDKNGVKFSYIKYDPKSRLYLENERRFDKSFEELGMGMGKIPVIIPPQGNDKTMKPFNPFLGINSNILGWRESDLDWFVERILDDDAFSEGFLSPNLSASNGIPYSPIYDPKANSFISTEYNGYNLDEFFKARQENMEKIKNETALSYAKTDFNIGEYAKVDEAKRVTLAREFYNLAKDGDEVPALVKSSIGKQITSIADIGNTAIGIGSKVPTNLLSGDYEREKIDAWRAVFAEIYLSKDARTLQDLGINLSDDSFDGYNKVEEVDGLGDTYTKYWDGMNVSQDLLNQIVNRQIMSRMTKRTSTKFRQNEDDKLTGDSYTFGTKGAGKIETAEQATPDSWNRLREVALDPQRIFPNYTDRSQLIDKLSRFYTLGKNQYGEDLLPDNLKEEKETRLSYITTYFSSFDKLLNTGLKTGESDDADAKFPYDISNNYRYKYFTDSLKAISSDEGKTNWNSFSSLWQDDLNLETGRDTLNANQVEALIRASSSLKEEQQKKDAQNQEGAGNAFSGVQTFATGGPVYAKNGTLVNYQPRGTDTVPAMLTPGEFVINRAATQKHLPVLKAINEGHYSRGGIIKYLSDGGVISPNYYRTAGDVSANNQMFSLSSFMGDIVGQITSAITLGIQNISSGLSGASATTTNGVSSIDSDTLSKISEFTNKLKSVADTLAGLSAIPQEISITVTHTHNVIINGDAALNKLSPDLQTIAMSAIREKFFELTAANQIAGAPLINPFESQV